MLILALSGTAAAAKSTFSKELDFRPGGNTIGGPGIAEFEAFGIAVFDSILPGSSALCATVANIGDFTVKVSITQTPQPASFTVLVPPGQTKTGCHPSANIVVLRCEPETNPPRGSSCEALWRVDEYHPVSGTDR